MVVLRLSFNAFHSLGARNLKDFFPKDVVLTRGNCYTNLVIRMEENGDFGKWTAGHLLSFFASLLPERKER